MASTNRSEQPWEDRERVALKDLAAQLEVACEALHEDPQDPLDDFGDQLEVTVERMPWQSRWREMVEQMLSDAREGRGDLAFWVGEWRTIESVWRLRESFAPRPTPDPLDSMEWREVDGEWCLVEREVEAGSGEGPLVARPRSAEPDWEALGVWVRQRQRRDATAASAGGIDALGLPHGVRQPLVDAAVLTIEDVQRRVRDGSICDVPKVGPSRLKILRAAVGTADDPYRKAA